MGIGKKTTVQIEKGYWEQIARAFNFPFLIFLWDMPLNIHMHSTCFHTTDITEFSYH